MVVGDDVGDPDSATGSKHPLDLVEYRLLVGREVDHAVGDDDVDGLVPQRDVLDVSAQELDIAGPCLGGVAAGQVEHLVGHVQPVGEPAGADPTSREQDVDPPARPQIEHDLALGEVGDGKWIAASQAGCSGVRG